VERKKNSSAKLRRIFCIVSVLAVSLVIQSCTTKAAKRGKAFGSSLDDGDYLATIDSMKANSKKLYGETNAFLYYMDIGVLFHYAGVYDSSNAYLTKAAEVYDELFAKSVTNEAASLLTNDNVRPYRAKPYELVFMHQLAAFNYMAAGRFDDALVETRKVQLHFNEWERTGAKDKKYHSDGMFHLFSSMAYERTNEESDSHISLYKSAEAYKMGPVPLAPEVRGFAYDRLLAGDREEDVKTLALTPNDGPNKWDAKYGQAEIVIVGYAGKGPNLVEQNYSGTFLPGGQLYLTASTKNTKGQTAKADVITLPAPPVPTAKAGTTYHIKISVPKVKTNFSETSYFQAQLNGKNYKSVVVNDLDKQTQKALSDAWGEIILRTAVRVLTKTIASQATKSATEIKGSPLLNLAKNIAVDVAADQMEKADTRMCFILPQQVHAVRIPVEPGTHTVSLDVYDDAGGVTGKKVFDNINVKQGEKKVLFHSSLR